MKKILSVLGLLLAASLSAQDVPFTSWQGDNSSGIVFYTGKYVVAEGSWGFFWLDAETLAHGDVVALNKCGFTPASRSGSYTPADCNGTDGLSVTDNVVDVWNRTGNCASVIHTDTCPTLTFHPPHFPEAHFWFAIGTWSYLGNGDGSKLTNSSQKTDLQGRTWVLQTTDFQKLNWHVSSVGGVPVTPKPTSTFPPSTPTAKTTQAPKTATPYSGPCPPLPSGYPADSPCAKVTPSTPPTKTPVVVTPAQPCPTAVPCPCQTPASTPAAVPTPVPPTATPVPTPTECRSLFHNWWRFDLPACK